MTAKPGMAVAAPQGLTEDPSSSAVPEIISTGHPSSLSPRRIKIAAAAGSVLLFMTIYLLRMDRCVGLFMDDAWYILLAKSLATGHGYTLINSPSPGIFQSLYPPAFPWLLSLAWRLYPQFPQNVWLLKSVSVIAMIGVGALSYYYFRNVRRVSYYVALGIALAAVLCPDFVFLITANVLSEGIYCFGTLLTIILIERMARARGTGLSWLYCLPGAVAASLTFLTRSVALGLLIAVLVYLMKERLPRMALIFAAGVIVCVGAWKIYALCHTSTPGQLAEQNGYISRDYMTHFRLRKAIVISSGEITTGELPLRVWRNIVQITGHCIEKIIFDPLHQGGWDPEENRPLSFILSLVVVAGFVFALRERVTLAEIYVALSLMIIVLWPWEPMRFVLPLSPFVIFYLLTGLRELLNWLLRWRPTLNPQHRAIAAPVFVWCIVALNILGNMHYLRKVYGSPDARPRWTRNFEASERTLNWVSEHVPKEAVIVSDNPAMVHLFTGHRTISIDEPDKNVENWNRLGVRYMVGPWNRLFVLPGPISPGGNYKLVYASGGEANLWVVDFGPKVQPLPWRTIIPVE